MRLGDFYRALRLSIERVRIGRFEAAEVLLVLRADSELPAFSHENSLT